MNSSVGNNTLTPNLPLLALALMWRLPLGIRSGMVSTTPSVESTSRETNPSNRQVARPRALY
ncbi:TPA: hypothetical protein EYN09_17310 [Candidatus Poribacteria bacterium]|nr:hypothetical protein [Candidatus Poribacteria bacterium]HIO48602.1 hypothetical protein [Candidatus Poribacteria bacterium]